jgi:hypothetical protein
MRDSWRVEPAGKTSGVDRGLLSRAALGQARLLIHHPASIEHFVAVVALLSPLAGAQVEEDSGQERHDCSFAQMRYATITRLAKICVVLEK